MVYAKGKIDDIHCAKKLIYSPYTKLYQLFFVYLHFFIARKNFPEELFWTIKLNNVIKNDFLPILF